MLGKVKAYIETLIAHIANASTLNNLEVVLSHAIQSASEHVPTDSVSTHSHTTIQHLHEECKSVIRALVNNLIHQNQELQTINARLIVVHDYIIQHSNLMSPEVKLQINAIIQNYNIDIFESFVGLSVLLSICLDEVNAHINELPAKIVRGFQCNNQQSPQMNDRQHSNSVEIFRQEMANVFIEFSSIINEHKIYFNLVLWSLDQLHPLRGIKANIIDIPHAYSSE